MVDQFEKFFNNHQSLVDLIPEWVPVLCLCPLGTQQNQFQPASFVGRDFGRKTASLHVKLLFPNILLH
jgi:hypothetical protein